MASMLIIIATVVVLLVSLVLRRYVLMLARKGAKAMARVMPSRVSPVVSGMRRSQRRKRVTSVMLRRRCECRCGFLIVVRYMA